MKISRQGGNPDSILADLELSKGKDLPWPEGRVFACIYQAGAEAKQKRGAMTHC